jgi:hypothetical protein
MMRIVLAGFTLAGAVACAPVEAARIVGTHPTVVWDEREVQAPYKPAPITPDEARSIALAHDAAHTCELTARAIRAKDRARGWAVMEQCVSRPDFTDLELLLSVPWVDELRAHHDHAALVAQVIAARGGDVMSDLRLVRRAKLPVFSLKAAVNEPDSYKGKLVLMRGNARSGRTVNGARALDLAETRVMAESEWVAVGTRTQSDTTTEQRDFANNNVRRGLNERFGRTEGGKVEILHNVSVETGLELMASVQGDQAFLESGTEYVLLLRFDGTREVVDGSVTDEKPMATVIGYFEPETGLFARLGR